MAVLLLAALLAGGLLAVQASANVQLTRAVGTPYGAATLQLAVAAALLLVVGAAAGAVAAVRLAGDVPAWQLLGGLASPLYITAGILLFRRMGALAAVALFVTGQMLASLALDLFGLLGVPAQAPSVAVGAGATAVVSGITLILRGQSADAAASRLGRSRAGWTILGITAGAGLPVQGAVNAGLQGALAEPLAVGLISFTVATLAIGAVLAGLLATGAAPAPNLRGLPQMPPWGWLGGACAAAYVVATFLLIPQIGAATTVALTVTGQQVASAAIDARGMLRMPRRLLTRPRLAGLVLLVAGTVLFRLG